MHDSTHTPQNTPQITPETTPIRTFECFGHLFKVTDGRAFDNDGHGSTFAYAEPIDRVTGERTPYITIRGAKRYASVALVRSTRYTETDSAWLQQVGRDSTSLTDSNIRDLTAMAVPIALAAFPKMTREEQMARALESAHNAGHAATRNAWKGLFDYGSELKASLTGTEREALTVAIIEGFTANIRRSF